MHLAQSLFCFIGITVVTASSNKNYFTSPVSSTGVRPVFTLGDQLLVSWITELGEFNVSFWQQSIVQESAASQGNIYSKIHASDQVTNFTWTVQLLGFDLSYSNEFFLWVNPDGPDGFISTYFNITEPTTSTTNTATATATTATSINTSNLATPASLTLASATDSVSSTAASPTSPAGLTTTGKVALGVGIGVGLPVLCALGALIWLSLRQASKASNLGNHESKDNRASAPMAGSSSGAVAPWSVAGTQQQSSPSVSQVNAINPKELQQYDFPPRNRFELPHSPH